MVSRSQTTTYSLMDSGVSGGAARMWPKGRSRATLSHVEVRPEFRLPSKAAIRRAASSALAALQGPPLPGLSPYGHGDARPSYGGAAMNGGRRVYPVRVAEIQARGVSARPAPVARFPGHRAYRGAGRRAVADVVRSAHDCERRERGHSASHAGRVKNSSTPRL